MRKDELKLDLENMKNIVILKNLPSNLIEEAIIVIKDKSKVTQIEKYQKEKEEGLIHHLWKAEDLKKIEHFQKENRKFVIKEAEMVVTDYLNKIEENKTYHEKLKQKKMYQKMKFANVILVLISAFSTVLCFVK